MVAARDMVGVDDHKVIALPHDELRAVLKRYGRIPAEAAVAPQSGGDASIDRRPLAPLEPHRATDSSNSIASSTSASLIMSGGMKRTVLWPQASRINPL